MHGGNNINNRFQYITRKQYTTERIKTLLRNWREQIQLNIGVHQKYATRYRRAYVILGIIGIVILAVASSTLFSSAGNSSSNDPDSAKTIAVAVLNIIALIIHGVDKYLDLGGQSVAHQNSVIAYDSLSRFIDSVENTWDPNNPATNEDPKAILESIRKQFDEAVKNSAYIPLENRVNALSTEIISDPKEARGSIFSGAGSVSSLIWKLENSYEKKRRMSMKAMNMTTEEAIAAANAEANAEANTENMRKQMKSHRDSNSKDIVEVVVVPKEADNSSNSSSYDTENDVYSESGESETDETAKAPLPKLIIDTNVTDDSNVNGTVIDSPLKRMCEVRQNIQQKSTESRLDQEKKEGLMNMLRYQYQRVNV